MDFGANKTPAEIIKESVFKGTHFRDIYSSINGKWYTKSCKKVGDYSTSPKIRFYYIGVMN